MVSNDRVWVRYEKAEVTVDTPIGPRPFDYAHYGGGDLLEGKYRGQDVSGRDIPALRKQIEQIEDEFQAKKVLEDKRRAVAKHPEEAVLYLPAESALRSRGGSGRRPQPARFEEVQVRGIDQRSGAALVTRATGDREQHSWGGVDSFGRRSRGSYLLRPLNEGERADLLALQKAIDKAEAWAKTLTPTSLGEAISDGPKVQLWMHFDQATGERWAEYDGITFRGNDARSVTFKVWVHLARQAGYRYFQEGDAAEPPGRLR
jgi:hypothetical protein